MTGIPPTDPSSHNRRSPKSIMNTSAESLGKPPRLTKARWSYQDITLFERHEEDDHPTSSSSRRRFDGSISSTMYASSAHQPPKPPTTTTTKNSSLDVDMPLPSSRRGSDAQPPRLTRKWKSVLSLKSMDKDTSAAPSKASTPGGTTSNPLAAYHELDGKSFDAMSKSLEAIVKERRKSDAADMKKSKSKLSLQALLKVGGGGGGGGGVVEEVVGGTRAGRRESLPDSGASNKRGGRRRTPRSSGVEMNEMNNNRHDVDNMEVLVLREKVRELESALTTRHN